MYIHSLFLNIQTYTTIHIPLSPRKKKQQFLLLHPFVHEYVFVVLNKPLSNAQKECFTFRSA